MNAARIACALPRTPNRRVSSDSCWPLRRADGTPFHSPAASPETEAQSPRQIEALRGGKVQS